uniref:Protein kinase domain-containing protein n=1 Tax=viral metagenome TaxID=1070528 RepID=A0A6C0BF45_9ZZZZ
MKRQPVKRSLFEITKKLNTLSSEGSNLPRNTSESVKTYNNQVSFEKDFLTNSRICSHDGKKSFLGITNADISGIKHDEVIKNLQYKFYNYILMEEFRCMINTIIDISDGKQSERQRINTYLSELKKFGEPSAYNYALKGDIKSQDYGDRKKHSTFKGNMVVIKCPREPAGSKELIHELVVGVAATNKLRMYVPNFSYVLDAFTCSGTTVNNYTKEVIDFCTSDTESVAYVIYENIDNATPLGKLAASQMSEIDIAKNFLKYLMQMALSLNLAEILYGFAHRDLHTENVLLRKVSEDPFYIPYSHMGEIVYVESPGSIATFIDYGMSHIKVENHNGENIHLGKLDSSGFFENIGISSKDSYTIADLYKIICFFIRKALENDKKILASYVSSLLGGYFYDLSISKDNFFSMNEDDILFLITTQWDSRYHIPREIVNEKEWNITDFIEYLNIFNQEIFKEVLLKKELPIEERVFGFFEECPPPEVTRDELNIHIANIPSVDVFIENPNNEEVKSRIFSNINTVIQNEKLDMSTEINDKNHRGFFNIPENEETAKKEIGIYIESIQNLNSLASVTVKLHNRIQKYSYCLDKFGEGKKKDDINKLFKDLILKATKAYDKNKEYVLRIKDHIRQNYRTLQLFIFGSERDTPLTEKEVEKYNPNIFYDVYTKYRSSIVLFEQISIKIN